MTSILDIHRRATVRGCIGYEARAQRWAELHDASRELCAKLPFRWRAVAMDNPTQNHTGTTNGRNHIVLDEELNVGRLHRAAGQALCGCETVNLWNPTTGITCKRCLELAERLVNA